MLDQRPHLIALLEESQPLKRAEADVGVREPHQHRGARRRRLIAPRQRFAGLEQRERLGGVDSARLQHRRRQHFAHAALQREAAIAEARIGGLAGAFCAQVQQPPAIVAQLGVEEAAPIADVGVVIAELVAVIAHGQGDGHIVRQRLEAPHMRFPFLRAEIAQADPASPILVAPAQYVLWKARGRDRVGESGAECGEARVGPVLSRDGHGSNFFAAWRARQ